MMGVISEGVMEHNLESQLRQRIAELEKENARLLDSLEFVKADRKALRDELYGPVREEDLPTEEEIIELMKNHVPGSGMKFVEGLGILPEKRS
jgi:hypothetical protein